MASADTLVGRVIDGKYRIERLLGRGGMGEVYAGTHLQLERPVAVKVLHGDLVADEAFAARFAREARTAAKLEHPNAVHVYDFGALEGGSAYLVMEFIEGVTLREVIRRNDRFPLAVVLDIMRQAAGAVGAAHARGIVHRDIKPENMMVRAGDDGRPVLKVVDFGLAKLLENQTSQLTKGSELIGTPRYMAPEQFSGGRVDERVDIYALGCVLFELLAGRTPFEGTFIEVVGKHVYAEVPTLASLGVEAPAAVEAVARRALEKDPGARTPSAAELVRQLEAACGPAEAAPDAITVPLPDAPPTAAHASEIATSIDPESFRTRAASLPEQDAFETHFAGTPEDEPTRVREQEPPTVFVPAPAHAADPNTRAVRPRRQTAVDLDPAVRPARRLWPAVVTAAGTGVLAFAAAGYWTTHQPGPTAAPASAPAAPAIVTPGPSPEPPAAEHEPETAPAPPAAAEAPKAGTKPAERARRTPSQPRAAEPGDVTVDVPDVPEPPRVEVGPDGTPTPESMRRLRRFAQQMERERRIREAKRRRQQPPPPPTP